MVIDAAQVIRIEHTKDGAAAVMICKDKVVVAVDGDGLVTFTREDLLSLAAAIPERIPEGMTDVAPFLVCDYCGRTTYALERRLGLCNMVLPDQSRCAGFFITPSKGALYPTSRGV